MFIWNDSWQKQQRLKSTSRKTPDEKERLKSTYRLSFANFGMLLGPIALLVLISDIFTILSLFAHGLMKTDPLNGFCKK